MRTNLSGRGPWHTAANLAVLGYLLAAAVWMMTRGRDADPGWLLVHLVLLGAATNAIVTWTGYFTATLLKQPQPVGWVAAGRFAVLNAAVLDVLVAVEHGWTSVAVAGAVVFASVVAGHAWLLWRAVRAARGRRFVPTVRFYGVAAGALLLGVSAGIALVIGVPDRWQPRLYAAHVHLNLLGWVALTVLGTEFTLWPTALRTRMVDGLERAARTSLLGCTAGLALVTTGVLSALRPVTAAGLVLYLLGVVAYLGPFVRTARRRAPRSPATWMLAASTGWLLAALITDLAAVLAGGGAQQLADRVASIVPWLLTGFVAQVLLGALTYLLPVVLGGAPAERRRTSAMLDRWGIVRVVALNAGVLLLALPTHPATTLGWAVIAATVIAFAALALAAFALRRGSEPVRRRMRSQV